MMLAILCSLRGAFLGIRVVLKFNVADVFGFDAERDCRARVYSIYEFGTVGVDY